MAKKKIQKNTAEPKFPFDLSGTTDRGSCYHSFDRSYVQI